MLIVQKLLECLLLLRRPRQGQGDVIDGELGGKCARVIGRRCPKWMVIGQYLDLSRIKVRRKPIGGLSACPVWGQQNGCKWKQECELQAFLRSHAVGCPSHREP